MSFWGATRSWSWHVCMTLAVVFAVGLFGWLCERPAHVSVFVLVCSSQVANVSAGIMLKLVMAKAKAEWGCWTIKQLWPFQVLLHRKQDPSQIWEELTCGGAIQPKGCPYLFYCKLVRNICECARANVSLILCGSSNIWSGIDFRCVWASRSRVVSLCTCALASGFSHAVNEACIQLGGMIRLRADSDHQCGCDGAGLICVCV